MKEIYENYINKIEELRAQRAAVVAEMASQYDELEEKFKQMECDETLRDAISKYLKKMWGCVQYTRDNESVTLTSEEYSKDNFREFEEVKNVVVKLIS